MSAKPPSFKCTGPHSANFHRWFIQQVKKAKTEGLSPLEADTSWNSYNDECPVQVQACAQDHPGPPDDSTKTTRANFTRQQKRFLNYLKTGEGECTVCCGFLYSSCVSHCVCQVSHANSYKRVDCLLLDLEALLLAIIIKPVETMKKTARPKTKLQRNPTFHLPKSHHLLLLLPHSLHAPLKKSSKT